MKKTLLILLVLLGGCKTYYAPNGEAFPRSWGKPPEIQLTDVVLLPDGYGKGSSTLRYWIMENKK